MSNKSITRNSNLELLRIFSMLMIIASHYVLHGGALEIPFSINGNIAHFINVGGKVGVIIFVLLSGYFLVDSKFRIKKILAVIFEVLFYTIIIFVLSYLTGYQGFSLLSMLKSFLPVLFSTYWFVPAYLGMFILAPFSNILINHLSKKQFSVFLVVMFIMFSAITIIPSINPFAVSDMTYFIFIYFLAAYLKKHWARKIPASIYLAVFASSWILVYLTYPIFNYLSTYFSSFSEGLTYYASLKSPFTLLTATSAFLFFKQIKVKDSKAINLIASTTFGIFLLHDNFIARTFIWQNIFHTSDYFYSTFFFLHLLATVCAIFIIGCGIDLFRKFTIGLLVETCIAKKKFENIDNKINSILT